jgi:hypothetical protein
MLWSLLPLIAAIADTVVSKLSPFSENLARSELEYLQILRFSYPVESVQRLCHPSSFIFNDITEILNGKSPKQISRLPYLLEPSCQNLKNRCIGLLTLLSSDKYPKYHRGIKSLIKLLSEIKSDFPAKINEPKIFETIFIHLNIFTSISLRWLRNDLEVLLKFFPQNPSKVLPEETSDVIEFTYGKNNDLESLLLESNLLRPANLNDQHNHCFSFSLLGWYELVTDPLVTNKFKYLESLVTTFNSLKLHHSSFYSNYILPEYFTQVKRYLDINIGISKNIKALCDKAESNSFAKIILQAICYKYIAYFFIKL